jgi:MFS family permease
MALGATIATVGLVLLAVAHTSVPELVVFSALLYAGVGFCFAAMPNLIVEAVPPEQTGQLTGFNALVRTIGASLGTQVSAAILAAEVGADGRLPRDGAYVTAFVVSAAASALAIVVALRIPRPRHGVHPGLLEEIGAAGPLAEPAYANERF